jgi:hypothetical protein
MERSILPWEVVGEVRAATLATSGLAADDVMIPCPGTHSCIDLAKDGKPQNASRLLKNWPFDRC